MVNSVLIVSIIPKGSARFLTEAANKTGAKGATVTLARGSAKTTLLQILGFSDSEKEVVYTVAPTKLGKKIVEAMTEACKKKRRPFGILFTIDVLSFIKVFEIAQNNKEVKEEKMDKTEDSIGKTQEEEKEYKLIVVIVNRGYADDVMDKARRAGATGGTVLSARGTAKEGDSKFFGLEIVPEKDMILILCRAEIADKILKEIETLPELLKKGSGVAFTLPANDFTLLGRKE